MRACRIMEDNQIHANRELPKNNSRQHQFMIDSHMIVIKSFELTWPNNQNVTSLPRVCVWDPEAVFEIWLLIEVYGSFTILPTLCIIGVSVAAADMHVIKCQYIIAPHTLGSTTTSQSASTLHRRNKHNHSSSMVGCIRIALGFSV